ncbi:helix-turn-helix domain-containing protein [Chryseobacterium sp. MP_3.2]|uniref:helix-turn-helix domain-containing protein n=1 Tax=Chryseobacterium sp. MP_3.2 TaxID=3071712 RepID=UPI002E11D45A
MNLNDRITSIIKYSELSSSEFADEIEVQRSNISHITSGRNKPSLDFLIKIKERFPELQWDWLINGVGEMIISSEPEPITEKVKPTSLPDLFSLIDDQNFGITESEDSVAKPDAPEIKIHERRIEKEISRDSQRLEQYEPSKNSQVIVNQSSKVKRIVLFYEDGKFESFEQ